MTLFQYRKV